ncbi:DUF1003 domain-containing protein [Luteimonas aquatica]|uniref:DUF1003 domain-containing protein n=1 Tax=Luteimonas aquatica TaxID=450364 RepID=UPI001F56316D|nr:DUF1003 domain-containing protein [Luteimonas aquatica]
MTASDQALAHAAERWLGKAAGTLSSAERRVLVSALKRRLLPRREADDGVGAPSLGERLADRVATFGGSWTFILLFAALLAIWTGANVWLLSRPFDPYPFIFLNLMLSMLAAVQAPIIMMSQNRQAAKDRLAAAHDYEVNLKAEIEIMALHEKFDQLRNEQMQSLLAEQQRQIDMLTRLLEQRRS